MILYFTVTILITSILTTYLANKYMNIIIKENAKRFAFDNQKQMNLEFQIANSLEVIDKLSVEYRNSLKTIEVFKKELDALKFNKTFNR